MVEKSTLQIEPYWFNTPPVHPSMESLDKNLMLEVLPAALRMTLDQLKKIDAFTPAPFTPYDSKEELFDYIKTMLDEGITPAKGYIKEIYVIKDFPFSGDLTIAEDGHVNGPGRIYLLPAGYWSAYLTQETFESIPKDTLDSLLNEFDLVYKHNPDSENTPHFLRTNPETDGQIGFWYIKDAYDEGKLFAHNLTFAYTNAFLEKLYG